MRVDITALPVAGGVAGTGSCGLMCCDVTALANSLTRLATGLLRFSWPTNAGIPGGSSFDLNTIGKGLKYTDYHDNHFKPGFTQWP